jgi:hypothetical protein
MMVTAAMTTGTTATVVLIINVSLNKRISGDCNCLFHNTVEVAGFFARTRPGSAGASLLSRFPS